jgi:hypothetical protein
MSPTLRRAVPFLVAAGVLAIVLAVMGIVRLVDPPGEGVGGTAGSGGPASSSPSGGGTSGSVGTASPPPAPSTEPGPDDPQSRFTAVQLGRDETSLDVTFWGGVHTCYRYDVRADEDPHAVSLSLSEDRRSDGPCIELAQEYHRTVQLDEPLGDRRVTDAATGEVILLAPRAAQ